MNPFAMWTELAFKMWGFGKLPNRAEAPEKQVAVAVIPTSDARKPKAKRANSRTRRKAKLKSKRAKR